MQGEELWRKGPKWLADEENWPNDIVTYSARESQVEVKVVREVFAGACIVTDQFDVLLENVESLCLDLALCA